MKQTSLGGRILKLILEQTEWDEVEWTDLAQDSGT